jgi:Flp pilus assembly protein TadD
MTETLSRHTRRNVSVILASILTLAVASLLVSLTGAGSYAQEPNRQLVQTGSANSNTGKRLALVIGNGAYTSAPPLRNPPNDARDMAATLRTLGFDVTSGINVNQRDMKRLIREFGQKLKSGGSGLFYYAGHGVQSKGRNYLVPVDAEIQSEAEVEDSGVDVSLVLNYMDDAQNGLNIVILDACRNNPFSRSFRSASDGLAQVDAPTGTLIAYATAPGRVASDGSGQNGLYTSELLKQMRVPGLSATEMFMRVRAEVMKQTASKQVPWEASSLVGSFYFSGSSASSSPSNSGDTTPNSRIDPSAFELSYWETIKNSTDPEDFKAYLAKYPNGQFVAIAQRRGAMRGPSSSVDSSAALDCFNRGNQFVNQKNFPAAEAEYRKALRLDPNNAQFHSKLADVLYDQERFAESEAEYRASMQLSPEDATLHAFLGDALRRQQKQSEADFEYQRAIQLDPNSAQARFRYGNSLYNQQKYREAEVEYRRAVQLNPNNAMMHAFLGDTLYNLEKYREAEEEYKLAVKLDPQNAAYRKSLKQAQGKK